MTNIKQKGILKILNTILVSCLFFVLSATFAGSVSAAPKIYFDPANKSTPKDEEFTIDLKIDTDSKKASGSDATILYADSDLSVKTVTNGGFFTDFSMAQSSGKLEIHAYFSSTFSSTAGSGTVARITFKTLRDSGNGNVTMQCSGGGNDTGIWDENVNNILDCGSLNQLSLTYISSSASGSNGPTNACGGTCGSVYNCDTGLFCYNGFCRNPDCRNDITCGCKSTPTPTKKPTTKPKSTATATPKAVNLTNYTPPPTSSPKPTIAPVSTPEASSGIDTKTAGLIIGAVILGIAGIILIISRIKNKKPPKFTPPTNIPPTVPSQPPMPTPPSF